MRVTSSEPLGDYPLRLTDRLLHHAAAKPDHTLVAKRQQGGACVRISYSQALTSARRIAQWLINSGATVERPLAILSDNDIEHSLLTLGDMLAGVPFALISAAYRNVSQYFGKLRHIFGVLTPSVVLASNASVYGKAIQITVAADVKVVLTTVVTDFSMSGRATTAFADLLATVATAAVDEAQAQVTPHTIGKLLFTSGCAHGLLQCAERISKKSATG